MKMKIMVLELVVAVGVALGLGGTARCEPTGDAPSTQPATGTAIDPKIVAELMAQLADNDSAVCVAATKKLVAMGEAVRPHMMEAAMSDAKTAALVRPVLEKLDGVTRGPDGKLLEVYRGRRVLIDLRRVMRHKDANEKAQMVAKTEKEIADALTQSGVKQLKVVRGSAMGGSAASVFSEYRLIDCQGKDPETCLKDVPYLNAAIVFEDGKYQKGLAGTQGKRDIVPAARAFWSWGVMQMADKDADLARWKAMPGVNVEFHLPPRDSGGGGGWAELTPKDDATLLEVFIWTKTGFDMRGK